MIKELAEWSLQTMLHDGLYFKWEAAFVVRWRIKHINQRTIEKLLTHSSKNWNQTSTWLAARIFDVLTHSAKCLGHEYQDLLRIAVQKAEGVWIELPPAHGLWNEDSLPLWFKKKFWITGCLASTTKDNWRKVVSTRA